MLTEKLFNYDEACLLEDLILTAIENGNRVNIKCFLSCVRKSQQWRSTLRIKSTEAGDYLRSFSL